MPRSKNIFVSSTSKDLQEHRKAVEDIIERNEQRAIVMEHFGSQPGGAVDVSLREVGKAHVFIGILAHRYGYVPPGMDKSVTEQEYDEAVRLNIPRLMYLVDKNFDWPDEHVEKDNHAPEKLEAFKQRIDSKDVRSLFKTPDNLAKNVVTDLHKELDRQERRRWLAYVGLVLLIAAVVILVALILNPDEEKTGTALADRQATNEAQAFLDRTSTAAAWTPTPPPVDCDICIGVAYFALPDDNRLDEADADRLADQVFTRIETELSEFAREADLVLGALSPSEVGRIEGANERERANYAEDIARDQNLDIVLYGQVLMNNGFIEIQPEFYVNPERFTDALEITGVFRLGNTIELEPPLDRALNANRMLSDRVVATAHIFVGLTFYWLEDYEEAVTEFEVASSQPDWTENQGLEVVHVLIGKAYSRLAGLAVQQENYELALATIDQAQTEYETAIGLNDGYARAYTGIAVLNYLKWSTLRISQNESDITLLWDGLEQLDLATQASDRPDELSIKSYELFSAAQINFALLWQHRSDLTAQEITDIENTFQDTVQKIIGRYADGRNPSMQELASEAYALRGALAIENGDEQCESDLENALELVILVRRRMYFSGWLGNCFYTVHGAYRNAEEAYQQALDIALQLEDVPQSLIDDYTEQLTQSRGRG